MYRAPIEDISFALNEIAGLRAAIDQGVFPELSADLVDAILSEAGRFAGEEVAPAGKIGDTQGATWADAAVTTPDGWADLYTRWREGGWNALSAPEEFGGQGLPQMLGVAADLDAEFQVAQCVLVNAGNAVADVLAVGSKMLGAKTGMFQPRTHDRHHRRVPGKFALQVEQIENVGFYGDVKLQYSLSYCQGGGLSFSCNNIKESLLLPLFAEILGEGKEKTSKIIIENSYFSNSGSNGYYCYASRNDIEYIFDYNIDAPNIENIVLQVETKIQNLYMELCKDLEKKGYEDIEYQCSDEAITETIIANDYEFLSNGKMY
jgi:hypothetical protein